MIASLAYPATGSLLNTPLANSLDNPAGILDQRIRQAQRGNLEAFNELVLAHQERVFRHALWMLGDAAAAEDACQEAFLSAYRKIHTFQGGHFLPWLLKIVTHRCLDYIRSTKRRPALPFSAILKEDDREDSEPYWTGDPGESPEKAAERTETGDAILRAIQKLSPEFRLAVILVDVQELDYAEACRILRIPLGTLKSRLARARLKLSQDLRKVDRDRFLY